MIKNKNQNIQTLIGISYELNIKEDDPMKRVPSYFYIENRVQIFYYWDNTKGSRRSHFEEKYVTWCTISKNITEFLKSIKLSM